MYATYIKRFFDIIISAVFLPFLAILSGLIAILIKIDDNGPVFYRANRLGQHGKTFNMFKFRTMKADAPDIRNSDGSTFNKDDDPRLTKIGKILRNTSIDELPQIINVFLGQMSFIGPRPDLPDQTSLYADCMEKLDKRLSVKPGITGYSQAYFRNAIDVKERLEYDLFYIDNIGFFMDCRIVFRTGMCVFMKQGVYKN